jgi:hypothetical protein
LGTESLGSLAKETAGLPGKGNPAALRLQQGAIFLAIGKEVIRDERVERVRGMYPVLTNLINLRREKT